MILQSLQKKNEANQETMIFSSPPLYLDPSNWPQQSNTQDGALNTDQNPHFPPPPPSGGGMGVVRPGSMTDRARLAKIPPPEAALKCPRCDSTNTKFCYFNNYNLSQPRHFCKTCRRYWTRGGALRNVPVGGGCRRNKRSKGKSKSKSSGMVSDRGQTRSNMSYSCTDHMATPQLLVHNVGNQFVSANYGEIGLMEQWRMQQGEQCHFLSNNLEQSSGNVLLYSFEEAASYGGGQPRERQMDGGGGVGVVTQLGNLKVEGNHHQEVNLSRNFLGLSGNYDHNQIWGGNNAWTDLAAGFNSSSSAASHLL